VVAFHGRDLEITWVKRNSGVGYYNFDKPK
jgi:hypothetical protein